MKEREFKTQIFRTNEQWGSGLFCRLDTLEEGGLTILSLPSVAEKLPKISGISAPVAMAADCCGIIYIRDALSNRVYSYDPKTGVLARIPCAEGGAAVSLVLDGTRLWVCDTGAGEIRACSLKDGQIVVSMNLLESPVAIALNSYGDLYALDNTTKLVYRFDRNGTVLRGRNASRQSPPSSCLPGRLPGYDGSGADLGLPASCRIPRDGTTADHAAERHAAAGQG